MSLGRNICIGQRNFAKRFSGQQFPAWSLHLVEWWIVVQFFGEFSDICKKFLAPPRRRLYPWVVLGCPERCLQKMTIHNRPTK